MSSSPPLPIDDEFDGMDMDQEGLFLVADTDKSAPSPSAIKPATTSGVSVKMAAKDVSKQALPSVTEVASGSEATPRKTVTDVTPLPALVDSSAKTTDDDIVKYTATKDKGPAKGSVAIDRQLTTSANNEVLAEIFDDEKKHKMALHNLLDNLQRKHKVAKDACLSIKKLDLSLS